jgi:biopolymer transport protein ExbB
VVVIDTAADTGEVHFKAPSLANATDTEFYIYYGNAAASAYAAGDTYGRHNVWRSEYKFVSHNGGGTDSTANAGSHTVGGGLTVAGATGKMGKASLFDGVDDYITAPDSAALDITGELTISVWMRHDSTDSTTVPFVFSKSTGPYEMHLQESNNSIRFITSDDVFLDSPVSVFTNDTWELFHWNYDDVNNNTAYYKNGAAGVLTNNGSGAIGDPIETNTTPLNFGRRSNDSLYFKGYLDEIRLYAGELAATWISTEFNNQNSPSTFYAIAAQESRASSGGFLSLL